MGVNRSAPIISAMSTMMRIAIVAAALVPPSTIAVSSLVRRSVVIYTPWDLPSPPLGGRDCPTATTDGSCFLHLLPLLNPGVRRGWVVSHLRRDDLQNLVLQLFGLLNDLLPLLEHVLNVGFVLQVAGVGLNVEIRTSDREAGAQRSDPGI